MSNNNLNNKIENLVHDFKEFLSNMDENPSKVDEDNSATFGETKNTKKLKYLLGGDTRETKAQRLNEISKEREDKVLKLKETEEERKVKAQKLKEAKEEREAKARKLKEVEEEREAYARKLKSAEIAREAKAQRLKKAKLARENKARRLKEAKEEPEAKINELKKPIEEERFQEAERRRILSIKKQQANYRRIKEAISNTKTVAKPYKKMTHSFLKNTTILYHDTYGRGKYIDFDEKRSIIEVKFDKFNESKFFSYPSSLGYCLFIEKTEKYKVMESKLKNDYYKQEYLKEEKHFKDVIQYTAEYSDRLNLEYIRVKSILNSDSQLFNRSLFKKYGELSDELKKWYSIQRKPYFARINYNDQVKYIGRVEVPGYTIDWRDKICKLYYYYNQFINVKGEYDLKLVREFDISNSIYNGYIDKYSAYTNIKDETGGTEDGFLHNILKNRGTDLEVRNIIQTIQQNQYEIITTEAKSNILVLGCAGSGKTMIMLHRLSYMIFNNDIDPADIFIVSLTKLLNTECNILAQELRINKSKRMTILDFYIYLVNEYYKANNSLCYISYSELESNKTINEKQLELLYSESYAISFSEKIMETYIFGNEDSNSIINGIKTSLIKWGFKFSNNILDKNDFSIINLRNNELENRLDEIRKAVYELPRQNVLAKLKRYENDIRVMKKDKSLPYKKKILEGIKSWKMNGVTIYPKANIRDDNSTIISVDNKIFSDLFNLFYAIRGKISKPKKDFPSMIDKYTDYFDLISDYKNFSEKLDRFDDYIQNKSYNFLSEIINEVIDEEKKSINLQTEKKYDFELYLHLLALNALFGEIKDSLKYVFIDEVQDYSMNELKLIRNIYSKTIINCFGDMRQRIKNKGLKEIEYSKIFDNNFLKYSINENYRNTYQITEYINKQFNLDMTAIGIDGKIDEDFQYSSTFICDEDERTALIVKDLEYFEEHVSDIINIDSEQINIIKDDSMTISKGKVNVVSLALIKGLEVENVYTITTGMSDNEKYVAFTRALKNLYILS